MKKKNLFLSISIAAIIITVFACKSKSEESKKDSIPNADTIAIAHTPEDRIEPPICFLYADNKDSTIVRLYFDGENVTGNMDWLPNEKDGAYGTLQGKIKDGVITADYNYTIEGSEQVEEKMFVLKGDILEEKGGELEDKNGKLVIKDPTKATTQSTLKKVDCNVIEKHFYK